MEGVGTWWRLGAAALLVAGVVVLPARPAAAVELTTPYPVVVVERGQSVTFKLNVRSPARERVRLDVTQAPRGWQAFLRGGGHRVGAVYAGASSPAVDLQVQIPQQAARGAHRVVVTARAASGTSRLPVELRVVPRAQGAFDLAVEFPELRGSASDTFRYDATLRNNTARQARFALTASGPEGWKVQARPSTQQQAATVTVDPNAEATIQVEADPPDEVQGGAYPVVLRATGEGANLEQRLTVQVEGSPSLTVQTADERLDVSGAAGDTASVQLVVRNTGSAPLQDVQLSASPPTGWEVAFEPATIPEVAPGEEARATARITPAGSAVTGDYSVRVNAKAENVDQGIDLRFAVRTSRWWGLVGGLIVSGAVGGLLWTFRRFGRR